MNGSPDANNLRVRFRAGSELDATPIAFLVEDMLPAGMLSALGGKDGMGKTLLGMEIIKCILTGEKLFGTFAVQQGAVYALFLDDPEFLVRARLEALGILDHPNLHIATENDVNMVNPKAMLKDLIKLKTGRSTSWRLRLDGPGQWHFHGNAGAYRKAILPERVLEHLRACGDSTAEEISLDIRVRKADVIQACDALHLDGRIIRGSRPRRDGKPGRGAIVYWLTPAPSGNWEQ